MGRILPSPPPPPRKIGSKHTLMWISLKAYLFGNQSNLCRKTEKKLSELLSSLKMQISDVSEKVTI